MIKTDSAIIRWGIAPAVSVVTYICAPRVDETNPPADLAVFFATSAALLGTFFIALALLSIASPLANLRIRGIIGYISFFYLALGAIAAVSGTVVTWKYWLYPCFVAVTVGTGTAVVLAITRVGIANVRTQRDEIHANLAQVLGKVPSKDSGSEAADQLAKLADLRDRGAISTEEFERLKARILT
jgi:hypothetical protein